MHRAGVAYLISGGLTEDRADETEDISIVTLARTLAKRIPGTVHLAVAPPGRWVLGSHNHQNRNVR
jgi:hypothetical protein